MRIDSNPLSLTQALAPAEATQTSGSQRMTRQSAGDQVQLSNLASHLSTNPERLAELTTAVRAGTYHVDPREVANSMITFAFGK